MIEALIDGNNFSDLDGFYLEAECALTVDFRSGRNLDAFNDLLRGGFGVHGYEQPLRLTWRNSRKSRDDLSWPQTIAYLEANLAGCHPSSVAIIREQIVNAKKHEGPTLYDTIVEIIHSHDHIDFVED